MNASRNWYPWRRWLRARLLEWADRWLPEVVCPKRYRSAGSSRMHHARRRRLKRLLRQRQLEQQQPEI